MSNDNRDEVYDDWCPPWPDHRPWTPVPNQKQTARLHINQEACRAGLKALDKVTLVSIDRTKHQPKESAMFEAKHTTRDNVTMLIAQMTDEHLKNTCNLAFKSITDVWASASPPTGDAVERALYRNETVSAKQAAQVIRQLVEGLTPYLLEAMLRPSVSEAVATGWRQAMKREQARPAAPTMDFSIPVRIQL